MLTGLLVLAAMIAKLFPETPTGQWLHDVLVTQPLKLASNLKRKHVLFALIVLIGGQAFLLAAPMDLALIFALDLSVYVDAWIAVGTAAAMTKAKAAWYGFKARVMSISEAVRSPAVRARKRRERHNQQRIAANDDEDGADFLKAA